MSGRNEYWRDRERILPTREEVAALPWWNRLFFDDADRCEEPGCNIGTSHLDKLYCEAHGGWPRHPYSI